MTIKDKKTERKTGAKDKKSGRKRRGRDFETERKGDFEMFFSNPECDSESRPGFENTAVDDLVICNLLFDL